jgi:signal transduction histidine kinase/DNA-binding response OmpR family regulator
LFLVFPYFIGIQWTFKIIMLTNIILFYFMWVLIPLNWKEGKLSSRISVMAVGIFYSFAIIQILRVLGVFPNNLLTTYAIEIGLIFQSLFHFASMDALVREEFKEKELAQQQALRTLRRADEMKDQLLANTSHELRTPLHGMIGLMDMILSSTTEKLTRKTKRQLQLVAENARRLNDMVGKLLDLAALQGHRVKINMESVILHTLVEAVLNLSQALVGKKPILLQKKIPQNLPAVSVDPNSLQQILLNLIANALKYTDSGKVTISAHLLKNKVRIEVADSGVGISQDQLENIFESFRRGESPKIREQEGLGLGLSICQELLKAHGSHLEVRSVPQEGSVFSFDLPVSTAPAVAGTSKLPTEKELAKSLDATIPLPIEKLVSNSSTKLQHILVVDDDFTNLEIVFGHVAGQYNLTSCDSGQDALNVLEKDSSIRLVLLDVMMPKLDGFEVCELIREKHSAEELPVLLLTALDNEEDIAQGYLSGANDYLSKPFRKTELLARIAAQLRLSAFHCGDNNDTEAAKIIVRQTLVATLQMSLEIWVSETEMTELDLAQKSNIWGTHLDNKTGTYRSRGLQKYLSEVSLPAYPRWRKVIQTAQFVIRHCSLNSASHKKLSTQLDLLTQHLQDALL